MRVQHLLFVCGVSALTGCGGVPSYATSTFEADGDGWLLGNNGGETAPNLVLKGGNPDGHICGQDNSDGDIWYFVAPAKFLGNASRVWGKRLTFDVKQGSIYNQIRGRDVVLNGGGLAIIMNLRFAPGLDWTPYSFRIDDQSGWALDNQNGEPASEADIRTVLSSLTSLRIRGEYVDGLLDTACIDNVYWGRD